MIAMYHKKMAAEKVVHTRCSWSPFWLTNASIAQQLAQDDDDAHLDGDHANGNPNSYCHMAVNHAYGILLSAGANGRSVAMQSETGFLPGNPVSTPSQRQNKPRDSEVDK